MVSRTPFEAVRKIALIVGSPGEGEKRLKSVFEDVKVVKRFASSHGFDEVKILVDKDATAQNVDLYFARLAIQSIEQRIDCGKNKKLFCLFYYSGHGYITGGTTRACLTDQEDYPFEVKIRNFKNEHPNSFSLGIFDACRVQY